MKELSIEEKAKRYDEAFKEASVAHKDEDRHLKATLERIFPTLKESEDEKIRKALKEYFINSFQNNGVAAILGVHIKDILAWLEKQGEKKSIWHNEDEEPKIGSLILLIMQSGTPIVAKIIEPNHTFNHGERWAYIDDLLEKQGGQKSYVSETMNEKGDFDNGFTRMMEREQKPTGWSEKLIADVFEMVGLAKIVREQENDALTEALQSAMIELAKYSVVPQPKQEWSEAYIADVFEKVGLAKIVREQSNDNLTNALQNAMIELSKFIPQPRQEWSEEDEEVLCKCLGALGNPNYCYEYGELERMRNWLKSLRPKSTEVKDFWKSADGDDLPEIGREVIALLDNGKVVFAHRPPEYWDGKNIVTGKVTRNYPKTYDKGGWNIPNVAFWLDLDIPKL